MGSDYFRIGRFRTPTALANHNNAIGVYHAYGKQLTKSAANMALDFVSVRHVHKDLIFRAASLLNTRPLKEICTRKVFEF